jgi:hypothetical protein
MVLRYAGRLAALVLAPIIAIAVYGLWLRVGQYGWTADRIIATACALVGACYAGGYLLAALTPGVWLKPLERTNIITAFVVLATILALFSPIADPARIAVADQVARLESGKIAPAKFDFLFLRFKAARFGVEALHRLKARTAGPGAVEIARQADLALRLTDVWERPHATASQFAARITVYPAGKALPDSFLRQDWNEMGGLYGLCDKSCDAYFADLDGDGVDEILLADAYNLWAYQQDAKGSWASLGMVQPMDDKVRHALRAGDFKTVVSPWRDIEVDGRLLRLQPRFDRSWRVVPPPAHPKSR